MRTSPVPQTLHRTRRHVLDDDRRAAGLSVFELWFRYFELGGMGRPDDVGSYLRGEVAPTVHEQDVLTHVVDERFAELRGEIVQCGPSGSPQAEPAVELALLGSFRLRVGGKPTPLPMTAQRVLAFLALQHGPLLRLHVAGSLWGDSTEQRAAGSLRSALCTLHQPGLGLVDVTGPHLRLAPGVAVDLRDSETLAYRILDDSRELTGSDLNDALLSLDLLPDWTEDWLLVHREYHAQLRTRALEALCRRMAERKRFTEAVQAGMLAVSVEPLRESARRALVAAHIAEGNIALAVGQYTAYSELLRDELGLEPSQELKGLVDEVCVRRRGTTSEPVQGSPTAARTSRGSVTIDGNGEES